MNPREISESNSSEWVTGFSPEYLSTFSQNFPVKDSWEFPRIPGKDSGEIPRIFHKIVTWEPLYRPGLIFRRPHA